MIQTIDDQTTRGRLFPKPLRRALLTFARAVRQVADLSELPGPDPLTEYHAREYLDVMESLLVEQLVTSVPTGAEREALLSVAGLDYLEERVTSVARDYLEED